MKKRAKRWCSLLMIFCLILSLLVPGTVLAADVESDSAATADSGIAQDAEIYSVGSDSVGTMLAEEARQQQQKQAAQVSISGLTFEGNRAKVEFSTDTDAELVVAVYDEQQVKMIASGKRMISASRKKVTVRVDTAEMPEYFVATAYLLDKETHNPLCSEYTTRLYTKNMKKLEDSMDTYRDTAAYLKTHSRVIVNVIAITFVQRMAMFAVTWFVYKAFSLSGTGFWTVLFLQAVISVSVDMLPLPGGMGISETLFLTIFTPVFGALLLPGMVLSRGLGYYGELLISALFTIVAQLTIGQESAQQNKETSE